MEEQETVNTSESQETLVEDFREQPHEHARPRLLMGVGAVILIIIIGAIVWSLWGDEIHEACFGEDGACAVELPDEPMDMKANAFDEFE